VADFGVPGRPVPYPVRLREVCRVAELTARQTEVVLRSCQGHGPEEIGGALSLQTGQVERTLLGAVRKLQRVYPAIRARDRDPGWACLVAALIRNRPQRVDDRYLPSPPVVMDAGVEIPGRMGAPGGLADELLSANQALTPATVLLNLVRSLSPAVAPAA